MKTRCDMTLGLLKKQESELELELSRIRQAIRILQPAIATSSPQVPKSKLELLREILRNNRNGIEVRNLPDLLKAMGHISRATTASTNWLCPSQLRPEDRFFVRKNGWIKPTPEFLAELDGVFDPCSATTKSQIHVLKDQP